MVKIKIHKYPCCGKVAELESVMDKIIESSPMSATCPLIECPECGKLIRVYVDIYSIELEGED